MSANETKCDWCEMEPVQVKLAITSPQGELLDIVALCEECRRTPISIRTNSIDYA